MLEQLTNTWPWAFVSAYWKPMVAFWASGAVYSAWRTFSNFHTPGEPIQWSIQEINWFIFFSPFLGCVDSLGWLYRDLLVARVRWRLKRRFDCTAVNVNAFADDVVSRLAGEIRIINRFLRFLDGAYYGSSTCAELHAVLAVSKSVRWDAMNKLVLDELQFRGEPLPSWLHD